MKRFLCIILAAAMLSLCGCSEYAEPDVSTLMSDILASQSFEADMTAASDGDIEIIFGTDTSAFEACAVSYSRKGGLADMAAVFKLGDKSEALELKTALEDYKAGRYDDFKGYAPMEAKKIEDGRVYVYGRYAVLLIVPDISAAEDILDKAFKS